MLSNKICKTYENYGNHKSSTPGLDIKSAKKYGCIICYTIFAMPKLKLATKYSCILCLLIFPRPK